MLPSTPTGRSATERCPSRSASCSPATRSPSGSPGPSAGGPPRRPRWSSRTRRATCTRRRPGTSPVVDGVRYKLAPLPTESALPLVDYLKALGCLDVEDRRRWQAADVRMSGPAGNTWLTVITAGSSAGQELRLIFDRANQVQKPFDGLGLLPGQLEALSVFQELEDRHGLVLFGAPAGQGLTTTGYSLVGRHDAYTSNIKTLEHEILAELDGVDQLQWDPSNPDVDYAT
ncbi:MAG: ATPase, T2SS/T4P/T4SS family, partial [Planctomycetota bacterium]